MEFGLYLSFCLIEANVFIPQLCVVVAADR